nr:MAG TPA: hypothetical protein [Caudoviricetes sp.]
MANVTDYLTNKNFSSYKYIVSQIIIKVKK